MRTLRALNVQILFVIIASPNLSWWGSNSESLSHQPKVLPLGHGSCWLWIEVTHFYTINMAEFAQIFRATWVQRQPGAQKFFQVRNFPRTKPTPVETPPSSCRIVNVNSISTQLNFRYLYYICVRGFECALFTSFILVGWFPRGCQFLIGRI